MIYQNGEWITNAPEDCFYCRKTLSYYMYTIQSKYLNGKFYCIDCYPKAVDIYFADLRLQNTKPVILKK